MHYSWINTKGPPLGGISHRSRVKIALLLLTASFNIMLLSIISLNVRGWQIGHTGLASVLPASYFVGLLLFSIFYLYLAFNVRDRGLMMLATAALVIVLFGTPLLVEGTPRFSYSFITGGVTDYIVRTGHTNTDWSDTGLISMFQNWPAVFFLGGFVELIGNFGNLDVLLYAPVVSQVLYILPLYMIFSTLFSDMKKVFAGCFFFFIANWVNQEYFSSQNLGLFLALFAIAILLKAIAINDFSLKFLALFVTVFSSIVIAHALSSIFVYLSVAIFLIYMILIKLLKDRRFNAVLAFLLILITLLLGTWSFLYTNHTMSSTAISSIMNINFDNILLHFQDSLNLGASTASDQDAQSVVIGLKIFSAASFGAVGLLAVLAYARYVMRGIKDLNSGMVFFIIMLITGLTLFLFPFYSDEAIIRVYLLSIICFAGFIVELVDHKKLVAGLVLFLLVFAPVSVFIHYGKENVDYTSPCSIKGLDFLFDNAAAGSALSGISLDAYRDYEKYTHQPIDYRQADGYYDFERRARDQADSYYIMNEGARNFAGRSLTEEYETRLSGISHQIYAGGDFKLYHIPEGVR